MRRSGPGSRLAIWGAALLLAATALAGAVEAGWFTRLAREAGEAGGKAGKLGIASLDSAAALVAKLPPAAKGIALAAHVTPEGHWKFVNREGQVYTAATPEELARAVLTLEPSASAEARLSLYLTDDTVFKQPGALRDLPPEARLHIVSGDEAYKLKPGAAEGKLVAEVRPNLVVALDDQTLFGEAIFRLARPMNRSSLRVLALEPGGPKTLSSVPSYDPATKAALIDPIDPETLPAAFGKLKHQTVVVTGRVEGDSLVFKPSRGGESNVSIAALGRAAEAADVSLVVLHSSLTRQPGGRNWLWQTVSVSGLDEALDRATTGDFLNALASGRGELVVSARQSGTGRIVISAAPSGGAAVPMTDAVSNWVSTTASEIMGQMIVEGVQAFVPDRERTEELDLRLVPGVPSWIQFSYLASLIAGLIGWEFSFAWWARLWPPERREEYRGAIGYHAARAARVLAMLLVFVPLVGFPAVVAAMLAQLWRVLTAPVRWWRWLRGKASYRERSEQQNRA